MLVVQVKDLSDRPFVSRELMLIKVRCNNTTMHVITLCGSLGLWASCSNLLLSLA